MQPLATCFRITFSLYKACEDCKKPRNEQQWVNTVSNATSDRFLLRKKETHSILGHVCTQCWKLRLLTSICMTSLIVFCLLLKIYKHQNFREMHSVIETKWGLGDLTRPTEYMWLANESEMKTKKLKQFWHPVH